ncbi:MAG: class I SAM-dependent methyltransferase [Actinobacteria bacterium]|nr:class I SAM-dependent methyltransferase [Actinomycetota bacterium]MCG2807636.1 class I SAM-dependent methyltransferase [Coriobacteriia bacterium]
MGAAFVDRFATISRDYATFRPAYPTALFDWLATIAPERSIAWDCGTGSGQAAVALAEYFERVVATDASESQLSSALSHPAVEYRIAAAEVSGLADSSVDLITVAQALHWFDVEDFFTECERVLTPGGVLAVWSYGPLRMTGKTVDRVVQDYYHNIVGHFWPMERALVDSGYATITLPFQSIDSPAFEMEEWWKLDELLGYLGTWSATTAYREAVEQDPLELIENRMLRAWRNPEGERQVVWPLTVLAGRKCSA